MNMRRKVWCVFIALMLSACASGSGVKRSVAPAQATQEWSGRISLQVQSDPPQQLNASFGLQGGAHKGQLDVFSPFGTTLATLQWTPQDAVLQQGDQQQRFASIGILTERDMIRLAAAGADPTQTKVSGSARTSDTSSTRMFSCRRSPPWYTRVRVLAPRGHERPIRAFGVGEQAAALEPREDRKSVV